MDYVILWFVRILIFALAYWIVTLLPLPPKISGLVKNALLILLGIAAILFLLGEAGIPLRRCR